jgi:hypothetical protein
MENVTVKVLDNSFISACITDIHFINLLGLCSCYKLVSSPDVQSESRNLIGKKIKGIELTKEKIEEAYKDIKILDISKHQKYDELMKYLKNRYPYLHKGELSIYLITVLQIAEGECFFITDDMQFRKKIPAIKDDKIFKNILGYEIKEIKIGGTIGFIKKLHEKKMLTDDDIEKIILNLRDGTFHITDELIAYLRGNP